MDDVPEDIRDAAREALIAAITASRAKTADEGIAIIAAALLSERTRAQSEGKVCAVHRINADHRSREDRPSHPQCSMTGAPSASSSGSSASCGVLGGLEDGGEAGRYEKGLALRKRTRQ
jgi:hypothetical protein